MTLTLELPSEKAIQTELCFTNGFESLPPVPEDPMIPGLWLSLSEARSKGSADGWFVSPDPDFVSFPQYREGYFQGFKSRLRSIASGFIPGSAGNLRAAIQPGDYEPF